MNGQYFWILVTIALLCVQPMCTSQIDGTDLGTFVVTAYNIANEADHPCEDADKILANGLSSYYCTDFLTDIIMQGSGVDNNNKFIQIDWSDGKQPTTASNTFFTYVPYITTSSGQRLEDGVSIAVDPSVIPLNSWVYIESIGWRRADDTGGAIQGKRIDIFMNAPRDDAMNFGRKSLNVVLQADTQDTTTAAADVVSIGFPVTLTLYVHKGYASGPTISGVQVTGDDGAGNSFEQTTNSDGYATITGIPGTWSFSASADGYEANNWDQEITETDTKDASLQEVQHLSESSAVGKWSGYFEGEQTQEGGTTTPFGGDITVEYYSDGTYTEESRDSDGYTMVETGSWTQHGNTIIRQSSEGLTFEEIIEGDNISGTLSRINEMGPFQSRWSVSRVHVGP